MGDKTTNVGTIANLKNLKWWQATIMIAVILVAAGYAASLGVNVSVSVNLEGRMAAIENRLDTPVNSSLSGLQKPYDYIISMVDAYYCLQNGTDGKLCWFNTNKAAVEAAAVGNLTCGTILLKNVTLASSVTYGSGIVIQEDYQGRTAYYSNNAMIYSISAGGFNCTVIYAGILNATTGYVQTYRLLVENGTSFPTVVSSGYLFFRTDLNTLYFYNGTDWTGCSGGGGGGGPPDDDSAYLLISSTSNFLFQNGTRALTANWNAGAYGIYGLTQLNATTIYCATIDQLVSGSGTKVLKLIVENGTSFPGSAIEREVFFRSDLGYLYVYNNSVWTPIGFQYQTQTLPYANITGTPDLSVYLLTSSATNFLFQNGTRALTSDWNIGGTYGVYGTAWVNSTNLNLSGQFWWNGQNRTDTIANPIQPYSYEVYSNATSGIYSMKNGMTGQIDFQSSDASQVITFAMGNLTSGRTWEEKVILKGNFTGLNQITIPSYTVIELQGLLKAKDGLNTNFIYSTLTNDIEIFGGQIDGNPSNQAASMSTIYFFSVSRAYCHDLNVIGGKRVVSPRGEGIEYDNCTEGIVAHNYVTGATYDQIKLRNGCNGTIVAENTIDVPSTSGSAGIQLSHGTTAGCVVIGNTVNVAGSDSAAGIKLDMPVRNIITRNTVRGTAYAGVDVISSSSYNTISGNYFYNCLYGMYLRDSGGTPTQNTLDNNYVYLRSGAAYGCYFLNGSGNVVAQNTFAGVSASNVGLSFGSSVSTTYVRKNIFIGTWGTRLQDTSASTSFETLTMTFSWGSDSQVGGMQIDANGEGASCGIAVPDFAYQIVRIRFVARSLVANASGMMGDLLCYGAADNEPWNTHSIANAVAVTTTLNFAADDIIQWQLQSGLDVIGPNDFIYCRIQYAATSGSNCATNCRMRCVEIAFI